MKLKIKKGTKMEVIAVICLMVLMAVIYFGVAKYVLK
jgi:hypothetical protein